MMKIFWLCCSFVIYSGTLLVAFPIPVVVEQSSRTLFWKKIASNDGPVLVRWTQLESNRWRANFKTNCPNLEDECDNSILVPENNGNGESGCATVETMTRNKSWLETWGGVATNAIAVALLLWCWDPSVALAVDEETSFREKFLLAVAPGLDTIVLTGTFLVALEFVRNLLKAQFKADLSVLQRILESTEGRLEGELDSTLTEFHDVLILMEGKVDTLLSIVRERLAPNQDEIQNSVERMDMQWQQDSKRTNSLRTSANERNNEIVALGKQSKWKEILDLYQEEGANFNNVNYSTIMYQLAKIRSTDVRDPVFAALMDDLAVRFQSKGITSYGTRAISNIAHSIGMLKPCTTRAKEIMEHLASPEVSTWLVSEGRTQEVSNTAWSFARMGIVAPSFFKAVNDRAVWLVSEGNTQDIGNMAWALATLDVKALAFFEALNERADWLVSNGNAQQVANIAWSFVTLDMKATIFFKAIEKRAEWFVSEGNTQIVANTAWAFATLGVEAPALFKAIESRAEWLVSEGSIQDVSNTAWAFAKLGIEATSLFKAIEYKADWLVSEGNPGNIANTAWAFATFEIEAPSFFRAIEQRADWLVTEGNIQHVSTTLWAFATLGIESPSLCIAAEKRADWLMSGGNMQDVANTVWAFATLGQVSAKVFQKAELFMCSNSQLPQDSFCKVCFVTAFANLNGVNLRMPNVSAFLPSSAKVSKTQQEISDALTDIGFSHELEVPADALISEKYFPPGLLSIDIANRDLKIAIEIDGPYHYLKRLNDGQPSDIENGTTKAKRLLLQQMGWNVINIRYTLWDGAQSIKERTELLRSLLPGT